MMKVKDILLLCLLKTFYEELKQSFDGNIQLKEVYFKSDEVIK